MSTLKESLFLRYQFKEEEIKEFASSLARGTNELSQAEEDKKAAMSQFADRINSRKAELSSLARRISNGYEMRMIDCEIRVHIPAKGMATIVREDTGEIVKERPMTPNESQEKLFTEDKA